MSINDILANGFNNLKDGVAGEALMAKNYFQGAVLKTQGVVGSNEADISRFFYAATRLGALVYNIEYDEIDDGLKDLGDILDAFGYSASESRLPIRGLQLVDPDPLPVDSPSGANLNNFLYNIVRPEIEGAIANLDEVSTSFNKIWTEPVNHETVESDYGDVLFFRTLYEGVLAWIFMQNAYDFDANIYRIDSNKPNLEEFLVYEPNFGTLAPAYSSDLAAAKAHFRTGLNYFDDAIVWMEQEADTQVDDYINLSGSTPTEIQTAKLDIVDAENTLDGPTLVDDNKDLDDPVTLDMSIFFNGLNLRSFLPPITGDGATGLFPDPTFAGIVGPEENLNEDIDPDDGIPDGIPEEVPPVLLGASCVPPDGSTYDVNATHIIDLHFNELMKHWGWSYDSNFSVGHDRWWITDRVFRIYLYGNLTSGTEYTITLNPSTHPWGFQDKWGNFLATNTTYTFTQQ
ncbi:Ig-like domain-containing protein [Thermodesulfobacteriota bacterium]